MEYMQMSWEEKWNKGTGVSNKGERFWVAGPIFFMCGILAFIPAIAFKENGYETLAYAALAAMIASMIVGVACWFHGADLLGDSDKLHATAAREYIEDNYRYDVHQISINPNRVLYSRDGCLYSANARYMDGRILLLNQKQEGELPVRM